MIRLFLLLPPLHAQVLHAESLTISFGEKAIIPTTSGQIGINPVTAYPSESYQNIGPNTQWYQKEGGTTKWIGVNTEYLTDLPYTTTVNGQASTTTFPAPIVAVTAMGDQGGTSAGDVSIALSPKLLEVFKSISSQAESACARRRKRLSCEPRIKFAELVNKELQQGGQLESIGSSEVQSQLPTVTVEDVTEIASEAKVGGSVVNIAIAWSLLGGELAVFTLASASISRSGNADNDDENECPSDASTGDDAPFCTDDECKGDNTQRGQKCLEGKYKGCSCLATAEVVSTVDGDMTVYDFDMIWMDEQQKVLQELMDENNKPPYCAHGESDNGLREPSEYCQCGDDDLVKTFMYSVATSTTSPYDPCPYTTDNGHTVTFQDKSMSSELPTPSVTCVPAQDKWSSRTDGEDFRHQFCISPNRFLRHAPPEGGFSNGQEQYFNVEKDPMVLVYAWIDSRCDTFAEEMNADYCIKAIDTVMSDCDQDNDDKKMGGEVTIGCQLFNIGAIPGPGRPYCPLCGENPYRRL